MLGALALCACQGGPLADGDRPDDSGTPPDLAPPPAASQHATADATYRDRTTFEAASAEPVLLENFDGFPNGLQVDQLFDCLVTFEEPLPQIFFGQWNLAGTAGEFSGGGLLPRPFFAGTPLILNFSTPVFGVGANLFDDFDGTPVINVITLTVTTANDVSFSVSEDVNNVGDTGFLGATSPDGIVEAVYSIDNTNGNLEMDLLTVAPFSGGAGDGCLVTPEQKLGALLERVDTFLADGSISDSGIAHSLREKLQSAQAALARGNTRAARNKLGAFIHHVRAQSGKKISPEAAAELIERATQVIDSL